MAGFYEDEDFYPEEEGEGSFPLEEEPDPFMPTPEDMPPSMQMAGLTPPYGTRREPSVNSVAQDPRDVNQFISESMRQQEYANMPEVARDVNEQADMIRGAAPRMAPQEIMRLLEEQMRGQGHMLPPPAEDVIQPEYEEDTFRGRRFGSSDEGLDMVQLAMAPRGPFERGDRPGRPSGEGGGGGNVVPFRKRPGEESNITGFRIWDKEKQEWYMPSLGTSAKDRLDIETLMRRLGNPDRYQLYPIYTGK